MANITETHVKIYDAAQANGGSLSAREAFLDLDMTSATLSSRICEMERLGAFSINRERRTNEVTGKAYTRYHIAVSNEEKTQ